MIGLSRISLLYLLKRKIAQLGFDRIKVRVMTPALVIVKSQIMC